MRTKKNIINILLRDKNGIQIKKQPKKDTKIIKKINNWFSNI